MKQQIRKLFTHPFLEKLFFIPVIKEFVRFLIPGNKLYSQNSFRICERNGVKYELDLSEYMDHFVYYNGSTEERNLMFSSVVKGMVILDIGANIGDTAFNFCKYTGATGMVYAFEPVDTTFNKLRKNASLNNFQNIQIFNVALSDKKEELVFGYSWNQNSSAILMRKSVSETNSNMGKATAISLDEFLAENKINKVDFIKLDVEGFEKFVLTGASKTLTEFKPILYVEVSDSTLKKNNSSAKDLIELIVNYGYYLTNARSGKIISLNEDFDNIHTDVLCHPVIKNK